MANLIFGGTSLNVIDRNGDKWLTVNDIAAALYPSDKRGSQNETPFVTRVRNLYRRNAEEFTDSMTALIEIEGAGGKQKVRVFSLRGAHLLGMFARSKKAKEFRRWVLDIIERHNHERGILTTQYHQALLDYATGKANASLCGKGLNLWKQEKPGICNRLAAIVQKIQPDMFPAPRGFFNPQTSRSNP